MSNNVITYTCPPPNDWRNCDKTAGVQIRVKTSDGTRTGTIVFILSEEFIEDTYGDGNALTIARENSKALMDRISYELENIGNRTLNGERHLNKCE